MTIIKMHGAPDQQTRGEVGDMYIDLDTTSVYICAEVHPDKIAHNGYISIYTRDTAITEYAWELIGSDGGDVGPVGQWLPMAADGVSLMGETVTIPGRQSAGYQIELLASNTNQYRVTIDGVEYSASIFTEADGYKSFIIDGFNSLYVSWEGSGIGVITRVSPIEQDYALKFERWVE